MIFLLKITADDFLGKVLDMERTDDMMRFACLNRAFILVAIK